MNNTILRTTLMVIVVASFALSQNTQDYQPILQQSSATGLSGQYVFEYASPIEAKREVRDPTGLTEGSYSYLDEHGVVQHLRYRAGKEGFQIVSSSLPLKGAVDTPEVAKAKEEHEAEVAKVRASLPELPPQEVEGHREAGVASSTVGPVQGNFAAALGNEVISDTPEVAKAKAEHEAAYRAALAALPKLPEEERVYIPRNQQEQQKQQEHPSPVSEQQSLLAQSAVQKVVQEPSSQQPIVEKNLRQPFVEKIEPIPHHHQLLLRNPLGQPPSPYHPFSHPITYPSPVENLLQQQPSPAFPPAIAKYAEDIPRSEFGETPEVALARKQFFTAYAQAKALLPTLPEVDGAVDGDARAAQAPAGGEYLADTPDVAIARARHAAAFAHAKALGLGA